MKKRLFRAILRAAGWRVEVSTPDYPRCVICVAPHTSNWDFILGELAYGAIGRRAGFLMKKAWFFFPLNLLLRAMGGVPVERTAASSLTDVLADRFARSPRLAIAVHLLSEAKQRFAVIQPTPTGSAAFITSPSKRRYLLFLLTSTTKKNVSA